MSFRPRMTKYIRQTPTPKQRAALLLNDMELFYGGAAGGGKSSWLLMAALQYVDIPGYSALILRASLKDADKPGSVLFRSRQWLGGYEEVLWKDEQKMWVFPTGATLQFGYLQNKNDKFQYDSAEYQFVGFDELTHFWEDDYEYLFTRMRGPRCPQHWTNYQVGVKAGCQVCKDAGPLMEVPIRMRAASNPGAKGHAWVKSRFMIEPIPGKMGPSGRQFYCGTHPTRPMIPAFLEDNAFIDQSEYKRSLSHVDDPVTRYRKEAGDWGVQPDGRFMRQWIHRYRYEGSYITLGDRSFLLDACEQFLIVDPAASRKATPGKKELTNKQSSYTAIGRWLRTPDNDICLMEMHRFQVEVAEMISAIGSLIASGPILFVGMEYTSMSIHLYTICLGRGFPMRGMKPRSVDKIARSVDAQNRMKEGKMWLPPIGPRWLVDYEDEIFSWTGDPEQVDDQVDVTSYASLYVTENAVGLRPGLPEVV